MSANTDTYKLFSTCIPVKGKKRSAIYDLGRESYRLIPNSLYEILTSNELFSLSKLSTEYPNQNEVLKEYFDFLLKEEFIFKCDKIESHQFPSLSTDWDYPAFITNSILEIDNFNPDLMDKLLGYIDQMGCRFLQFRFLSFDENQFNLILDLIEKYRFNGLELIIEHAHFVKVSKENLIESCGNSSRKLSLVIQNGPKQELQRINDCKDAMLWIDKSYQKLKKEDKAAFYSVNMNLFLESKNHNNYSNRKLFISSDGTIKNTPFSYSEFGNIAGLDGVNDLIKIVQEDEFQKDWKITNDMVVGCKSCEFRYMCVKEGNMIQLENGLYKRINAKEEIESY